MEGGALPFGAVPKWRGLIRSPATNHKFFINFPCDPMRLKPLKNLILLIHIGNKQSGVYELVYVIFTNELQFCN